MIASFGLSVWPVVWNPLWLWVLRVRRRVKRVICALHCFADKEMPPISSCPSPLLSSLELSSSQAMATRSAAAAFFLTGRANFWGSAFHIEHFINAVRQAADEAPQEESKNGTVLIDVGAAPYNTVGGDISHLLLFLTVEAAAADPRLRARSRLIG